MPINSMVLVQSRARARLPDICVWALVMALWNPHVGLNAKCTVESVAPATVWHPWDRHVSPTSHRGFGGWIFMFAGGIGATWTAASAVMTKSEARTRGRPAHDRRTSGLVPATTAGSSYSLNNRL